jgi:hypothetical protein
MTYFNNITKKTQGKDFNFYNRTSVSSATFSDTPDLIITFANYGLIFTNETSAQIIEVSFNGNTVHCELDGTATSTTRILKFLSRQVSMIWFRVKSGSAGPATITTTAW